MGEAKVKEERKGQIWNIWLTLAERYESRGLLLGRQLENQDAMRRNNNAIDAFTGDCDFTRPDFNEDEAEEAKAWAKNFGLQLRGTALVPVELSIDNVDAVLDAIDALFKVKKFPADLGYRLRNAIERYHAAKKGEEIPGEAERPVANPTLPAAAASSTASAA